MPRHLTDQERAEIARNWPAAAARGGTQEKYAHACGIAPRTLRSYLQRFPPDAAKAECQMRAILKRAVEQLGEIMRALDAEAASPAASANDGGLPLPQAQGEIALSDTGNPECCESDEPFSWT